MTNFRRLGGTALLAHSGIASEEALQIASSPGGCEGNRYPIFVELEAAIVSENGYTCGGHMVVEFILPGKPGRWRAAGEITLLVNETRPDAPMGLGLELLGLALTGDMGAAAATSTEAQTGGVATEEPTGEVSSKPAFDATDLAIDIDEVAGMLADLLGRDVAGAESEKLQKKIADEDIIAGFRNDEGAAVFLIAFDKRGAARIGGSLTMLPAESVDKDSKGKGPLEGEPLENAGEVLNIMSALFHEAGSPHVVLAETITGKELEDACEGEFQAIIQKPTWSLSLVLDIEEYGPAEVLLLGK